MSAERYIVLGLAQARSPWFRAVAQWANAGIAPLEFVKCMSPVEVRAHLAGGRAFSALLADGALPAVDRDLIDSARSRGCAVVIVDDVRVTRDWAGLGASAVVNPLFTRDDLLELLSGHAPPISRRDAPIDEIAGPASPDPAVPAKVAMVCGPGGTGASTAAIALAQGLCDDLRYGAMVLLADFALHAEQAMLHDARDVVPGLQELVDAHRSGRPAIDDVPSFTFDVRERGYQLLLGLRRARDWSSVRRRALQAAFDSLTAAWRAVVVDTDSELEGEDDGGSADVEDRHALARTAAARADVVFAVGLPGMKGVHALVRVVGGLLDHGVPAARIVPVLNMAPKPGRARAELTEAVSRLLGSRSDVAALPSTIYLPERRVDDALRDGIRLPSALTAPLAGAFAALAGRSGPRDAPEPQLVAPGSLGHWSSAADLEAM